MNKKLEEIILEIVLEEFESGHVTASDKESFNEILFKDFNIEAPDEAFDFYAECRNMGPSGFYLMYKDELDFSSEFKAEYGFEEEPEDLEEEPLTEASEITSTSEEDSYRVQELDLKGNKLDQFANFGTAEEAIAFAKTLKTPAEVIDNSITESINEERVIWTNIDSLEEAFSRDVMISELKAKGKNYNFNKYSDAQIYRMYEREMNKKVVKPTPTLTDTTDEEDVEYIETSNCPQCGHQLTDFGECPVCDLGDEEERTTHMLYLDESIFENVEKSLEEGKLVEGPLDGIKKVWNKVSNKANRDIEYGAQQADTKEISLAKKLANNLNKILASSYNSKDKKYLISGKWLNYDEFIKGTLDSSTTSSFAKEGEKILAINPDDPRSLKLKALLNAVVVDAKGNIIRKGLEVIKPGQLVYRKDRADLLEIKDGYRAEDIIGISYVANNDTNSTKPNLEANLEATTQDSDSAKTDKEESNNASEDIKTPDWITNESIKAAITLLAKRKGGSADYYDKDGNLIDYRKISTENVNDIFTDKEATKPFVNALEEVKKGLAKRKAAAIKSAALFGESYDDSMRYDDINEVDLDEGLTKKDMSELLNLSKQLGIETVGDLDNFSKREIKDGEDLLTAMKRYKGEIDGDIEPLEEVFSEDVINEEFTNYEAIKAHFEADKINYGQREAFDIMLNKACRSLNIDPDIALIYEDRDREFDPLYFDGELKELQYNTLKIKVFDLDVARIEFKGTIYIIFKSQADASSYMNYAH